MRRRGLTQRGLRARVGWRALSCSPAHRAPSAVPITLRPGCSRPAIDARQPPHQHRIAPRDLFYPVRRRRISGRQAFAEGAPGQVELHEHARARRVDDGREVGRREVEHVLVGALRQRRRGRRRRQERRGAEAWCHEKSCSDQADVSVNHRSVLYRFVFFPRFQPIECSSVVNTRLYTTRMYSHASVWTWRNASRTPSVAAAAAAYAGAPSG